MLNRPLSAKEFLPIGFENVSNVQIPENCNTHFGIVHYFCYIKIPEIVILQPTEMLSLVCNIIIYSGIVQGIYSALVLTHTRFRNPANTYLAILLVVLSASILHSVFVVPYLQQYHLGTLQIKEPFILLVVPLIWFYVKKLNEPQFHFGRKQFIHFVPFAVVMFIGLMFLSHNQAANNDEQTLSHSFILSISISVSALCQYIFYLDYILKHIQSFKAKALRELSNTENIDLTWLRIFLFTFLTVFVLLVFMMAIVIHRLNITYFNNVVSIVFALAIYVLGYKGLFQQTILPANTIEELTEDKPHTESKIDDQVLNRLLDYMDQQKPYHDPELTLTSLANLVNIGRNQLSEIINTGTGNNFYDFVNKYRVDEVKQLMQKPKFKDFTILAIAFEAGFPSKSTFNSIFKKFTGLTPSAYRNRLL
jgi:AraC-like DNA-binding protein